jgi:hypothetical protein
MQKLYIFKKDFDDTKCPICGYSTTTLFVLATDKLQAETLFEIGKGTCANCLVDLIMEKGYVVCNPFKPNPPKPKLKPKLKRRKP